VGEQGFPVGTKVCVPDFDLIGVIVDKTGHPDEKHMAEYTLVDVSSAADDDAVGPGAWIRTAILEASQ
jgi:hypothetical protein